MSVVENGGRGWSGADGDFGVCVCVCMCVCVSVPLQFLLPVVRLSRLWIGKRGLSLSLALSFGRF